MMRVQPLPDAVKEWTSYVHPLIEDGAPLEYAEVRALSDEGWALVRKLRFQAQRLRKLSENRGKYARDFEAEARRLEALADDIEDLISALWGLVRRW